MVFVPIYPISYLQHRLSSMFTAACFPSLWRSAVFIENRGTLGIWLRRSPVVYAFAPSVYPIKQMPLLIGNSKLVEELVVFFPERLFLMMFFLMKDIFAHPVEL